MIGAVRNVVGLQLLDGLLEGSGREPLRYKPEDDVDVLRTLCRAGETWVAGQLRLIEHRAEPLKQMLGRSSEDDPSAVKRLIGTAGPARVLKVPALTHDTLPTIEGRCVFHDAEGRLVEGRVDPLPLASRVAMAQSGQDPKCRKESGHVVGIHRRRPCGRPVRMPVHVPRPAKGRPDGSVAGPLIEGPRLAKSRHTRHHQPRVDRVEHLPAEPPSLEDARAEVLEDDIALGHEAAGDFLALGSVKVERDELLVPIVGGKPVAYTRPRTDRDAASRHRGQASRS